LLRAERSIHELLHDDGRITDDEEEEEDLTTMAFSRDPREFEAAKYPAPSFDIDTQRHSLKSWKVRWTSWLGATGISQLRVVDPGGDADVTTELVAAVKRIKADNLKLAFTGSTIDVMTNLTLSADDMGDADAILKALETHINGATNKRVYRSQLARRVKAPGENLDDYIIALRDIASRCKIVALTAEEALEDRLTDTLISNVGDTEVSEKLLQLKEGATFQEVVDAAGSIFSARVDSKALSGNGDASTSRFVQNDKNGRKNDGKKADGGKPECGKCGRWAHKDGQTCPAEKPGVKCHHCGQAGHFDRKCPSTVGGGGGSTSTMQTMSGTLAVAGLDPSATDYVPLNPLKLLPLSQVHMKTRRGKYEANILSLLDTGANHTCLPMPMLAQMNLPTAKLSNKTAKIEPPNQADGTPGRNMTFMGTFLATLKQGGREVDEDVYVWDGLPQPLISRDASLALKGLTKEF
jgi:hypothetical protein